MRRIVGVGVGGDTVVDIRVPPVSVVYPPLEAAIDFSC